MTRPDTHPCPVERCTERVAQHQLMCRRHWKMVPRNLQSPVYATWRDGAGYGTEEHDAAMKAAITAVNEKLAMR